MHGNVAAVRPVSVGAMTGEELEKKVMDPVAFGRQVEAGGLVIGFSDAVPWWGLLKREMQLHRDGHGGRCFQTRGAYSDEARKFRITLDLAQVLQGYVTHSGAAPRGEIGRPMLVVGGVHCRLDNISMEGKWLESEEFSVSGERVTRLAGNPVGNLMQAWMGIALRKA